MRTHSWVDVHEAEILEAKEEEVVLLHVLFIQRLGRVQPPGGEGRRGEEERGAGKGREGKGGGGGGEKGGMGGGREGREVEIDDTAP